MLLGLGCSASERAAGQRENATRLLVKMRGLPDAAAGNGAKLIIERNLEVLEPFSLHDGEEEEERARMATAVDKRDCLGDAVSWPLAVWHHKICAHLISSWTWMWVWV